MDIEDGADHPDSIPQAYTPTMDLRLRLNSAINQSPLFAPSMAPSPTQLPTFGQPLPTAPASLRSLDEVLELKIKTQDLENEVDEI